MRQKQSLSYLILYYSFAFPYFTHCNHVWGSTYPTNLTNVVPVQKKLIRMITCSRYRVPLMMANILMFLFNVYMTHIFVYQCLHGCVPDMISTLVTELCMATNTPSVCSTCSIWKSGHQMKWHENKWSKYMEINTRKY